MPEPCFFCADPNTVICTFCNIFATCIQHVDIHRPDQVLYCTALYNSLKLQIDNKDIEVVGTGC